MLSVPGVMKAVLSTDYVFSVSDMALSLISLACWMSFRDTFTNWFAPCTPTPPNMHVWDMLLPFFNTFFFWDDIMNVGRHICDLILLFGPDY